MHPHLQRQIESLLRGEGGAPAPQLAEDPALAALLASVSQAYEAFDQELRAARLRMSRERQQLPVGLVEWDRDWRVTVANPAAEGLFGWPEGELLGRFGLHRLVHPVDHGALALALQELEAGRPVRSELLLARTRQDEEVECEWTLSRVVDGAGATLGYTALVQDVSERLAAERALRVSEERYSLAVSAARDGIWDHDVEADSTWFSPRCYQILEQPFTEPWRSLESWLALVHVDDRARARHRLASHLHDGRASFEDEWRMLDARGRERWILVRGAAIRDAAGHALRVAGSMSDVTERKRYEQQLLRASMIDSLTGLANRRQLLDAVARRVRRGTGPGVGHLAVLFIDMDRFKDVNDRLGHAVGDQLLAAFGRRLGGLVRAGDTVARLGGDEFAVLMPSVRDGEEALLASERIQRELRKPFEVGDHRLTVLGSVGIASTDQCPADPDALLRAADIAMYSAKGRGSGGIALFQPRMYEDVRDRVELINDLRGAIERGQLRLVFQPIVEVHTGRATGFEALLRWNRDGVEVSPAHFVPLAEEAGMMSEIGEWVVSEAARWVSRWATDLGPALYVSVNMSARELELTDLPVRVAEALARSRVRPQQIAIEVTETSMIHAPELSPRLAHLRATGHRVLMDDFGTGYASLQNLAQLEFDAIKIDRSFARQSAEGQSAFLEAIAHLAWRLGKQVIIEGVEDEELLARLTVLGIDYVQGFAIARPMEADRVVPWFKANGVAAARAIPVS